MYLNYRFGPAPTDWVNNLHCVEFGISDWPIAKRKTWYTQTGEIRPDLRLKYDLFRHIPKRELITKLAWHLEPIYDLALVSESTPCAFKGADQKRHSTLFRAMGELAKILPTENETSKIALVDPHDVNR